MRARLHLAVLLTWGAAASLGACTCGGKDASGDWKALFDTLIKGLPEARTEVPIEAVPAALAWVATSPDPEAWRAFAAAQPFAQGLMETPAFEDVVMSRTYLAVDGMRRTVARAAALTGDPEDAHALWRGPTALGVEDPSSATPVFVLVKHIDPSMRAVVRLAAAFASTKDARESEVGAIKVRTLDYGGRTIAFAVFKNLLVIGSDTALVERSAALAQKSPRGDDTPAAADPLLPATDVAGIHARVALAGSPLADLVAVESIGVSLVADAQAPLLLRRGGGAEASDALLGLLAYAPASTTLAVVDGGAPQATVVDAIERLAGQLEAQDAEAAEEARGKKKRPAKVVAAFDGAALAAALRPGTAILLGVRDEVADRAAVGPVVVLGHADRAAVEAQAQALIAKLTGAPATRTVLEDAGGAVLLSAGESQVTAGVTADALVLALDADGARRALTAGAGKAPSVRDRARLTADTRAAGGVFVDLPKTAAWLEAFYGASFAEDDAVDKADAMAVLAPTFAALGKGPALFARLAPGKSDVAQGPLEVLP